MVGKVFDRMQIWSGTATYLICFMYCTQLSAAVRYVTESHEVRKRQHTPLNAIHKMLAESSQ